MTAETTVFDHRDSPKRRRRPSIAHHGPSHGDRPRPPPSTTILSDSSVGWHWRRRPFRVAPVEYSPPMSSIAWVTDDRQWQSQHPAPPPVRAYLDGALGRTLPRPARIAKINSVGHERPSANRRPMPRADLGLPRPDELDKDAGGDYSTSGTRSQLTRLEPRSRGFKSHSLRSFEVHRLALALYASRRRWADMSMAGRNICIFAIGLSAPLAFRGGAAADPPDRGQHVGPEERGAR